MRFLTSLHWFVNSVVYGITSRRNRYIGPPQTKILATPLNASPSLVVNVSSSFPIILFATISSLICCSFNHYDNGYHFCYNLVEYLWQKFAKIGNKLGHIFQTNVKYLKGLDKKHYKERHLSPNSVFLRVRVNDVGTKSG